MAGSMVAWMQREAQRALNGAVHTADAVQQSLTPSLDHRHGLRLLGDDDAWLPIADVDEPPPSGAVLLVHGLDEPGDIWDDLAPRLAEAGHPVLRFDYPNDQPAAASADLLLAGLRELRARGVEDVAIVAHSMGGLISRDALTRPGAADAPLDGATAAIPADLPAVTRLITIGTPNAGSPLAPLRGIGELREQLARIGDELPWRDPSALLAFRADGLGEAGDDLTPGSPYLEDLNARPLPPVPMTVIIGTASPVTADQCRAAMRGAGAAGLIGEDWAERIDEFCAEIIDTVGDGVVTVDSARLDGVDDTVYLAANHRSMVRRIGAFDTARRIAGQPDVEPPGIEVILDRLAPGGQPEPQPVPGTDTHTQ